MFRPKTFYSVLAPMYYFCKIFGLTPFKINDACYQKSKLHLSWSLVIMSTALILSIIRLDKKEINATSILTSIPEFVNATLSPLSMFLHMLFGCIFSNKILQVLQGLSSFDNEMYNFLCLNLKHEYRKEKLYLILGLSFTFIYAMLSLSLSVALSYSSKMLPETLLLFVMPTTINAFVDLQFCAIILCLRQRFRWLNEKIVNISKDRKMAPNFMETEKPIEQFKKVSATFDKIRQKHHVLCIISKEVNSSYSVQVLLIVVRSFVTLFTGLFYCGRYLIFHYTFATDYAIYNGVQLSLAATELVVLAIACSITSAEAHRTGTLIHNTMGFDKECKRKIKLQISFFSLQLLHQNVRFTACRLFEINGNLLLTVLGAITTYLVFVIQFQIQDYRRYQETKAAYTEN